MHIAQSSYAPFDAPQIEIVIWNTDSTGHQRRFQRSHGADANNGRNLQLLKGLKRGERKAQHKR
jgi:hypothetical protein